MMPEGISCRAVFTPLMTSVWPALWPPWKRTTPCAWSVSQSTTLPLPSSPHWVPTTTTLRPGLIPAVLALPCCMRSLVESNFVRVASDGAQHPAAVDGHQLAVAGVLLRLVLMAGQHADHRLARFAQAADFAAQRQVFAPRRAHGRARRMIARHLGERLQVQAEAHRRALAPEYRADLVVATAAHQRI